MKATFAGCCAAAVCLIFRVGAGAAATPPPASQACTLGGITVRAVPELLDPLSRTYTWRVSYEVYDPARGETVGASYEYVGVNDFKLAGPDGGGLFATYAVTTVGDPSFSFSIDYHTYDQSRGKWVSGRVSGSDYSYGGITLEVAGNVVTWGITGKNYYCHGACQRVYDCVSGTWSSEEVTRVTEMPELTLAESIFVDPCNPDDVARDRDNDRLKDDLEGYVANYFRPYYKFDFVESARRDPSDGEAVKEPVTLFQVRPTGCIDCPSYAMIRIRFAFLFDRDGGYGSCASFVCTDDHPGDNDKADYYVKVTNRGRTVKIEAVAVGIWMDPPISWPDNVAALEVYYEPPGQPHPVIYMSGSKHHLYLDSSYDCWRDSYYTDYFCNDNVDGRGDRFLADLQSHFNDGRYNNVGEPESHPDYFVDDIRKEFPTYAYWCFDSELHSYVLCDPPETFYESAWSTYPFRDSRTGAGPMKDVWAEDFFGASWIGGPQGGVLPGHRTYLAVLDVSILANTLLYVQPDTLFRFPGDRDGYSGGTKLTSYGTFEAPAPGVTADSSIYFSTEKICPERKLAVNPGGRMRLSNGGALRFPDSSIPPGAGAGEDNR